MFHVFRRGQCVEVTCLSARLNLTCRCVQWSHCKPSHSQPDTWPAGPSSPDPAAACSVGPGSCTEIRSRNSYPIALLDMVLTLQCRGACVDLKIYLLRVLWYLSNSRVTRLSRDTHPGVHSCHSNAELLHGYYNDTVRNTWKDTETMSTYSCNFIMVSPKRSHFIHQCMHPRAQVQYLRPGGRWEAPTEP